MAAEDQQLAPGPHGRVLLASSQRAFRQTPPGVATRVIQRAAGRTVVASFYGRGAAGTTRFVVDIERELLLGATFVGPEVADFLQAATIAIVGEVPLSMLAHAIAPFPTRSELWLRFLEAYEAEHGTTLHAEGALAGVNR